MNIKNNGKGSIVNSNSTKKGPIVESPVTGKTNTGGPLKGTGTGGCGINKKN